MWLMVMFDLPVLTKEDRRNYREFHDKLENDGFCRIQFSVYGRPCATEENTEVHLGRVRAALPPDGEVRVLKFTDKQWGRMLVFRQMTRERPEEPPAQLEFFDEALEPLFDERGDEEVEARLQSDSALQSEISVPTTIKRPGKGRRRRKDDEEPRLDLFD